MADQVHAANGGLTFTEIARAKLREYCLPQQPTQNPPAANRGVERTRDYRPGRPGAAVVDWISCTFKKPAGEVLALLHDYCKVELVPRCGADGIPRGFRGYTHSMRWLSYGIVAWHPERPEMGIHVDLPQKALGELHRMRQLLNDETPEDGRSVITWLLAQGATFTRVDIALDDFAGVLQMALVRKHFEAECYVARVHADNIQSICNLGGGATWYVGSPTSDKRLRIYNKREQLRQTGAEEPDHDWVRVEGQYRRKYAQAVANGISDGGLDIAGVFRDQVDFKVIDHHDSNMRRRDTVDWWNNWLGGVSKMALQLPQAEYTMERAKDWFAAQVAPTYAMLNVYFGPDYPEAMATLGAKRWKAHHKAALASALYQDGSREAWPLEIGQ